MNPPFDNGDKHLLKAIDIMYNGQIVCLTGLTCAPKGAAIEAPKKGQAKLFDTIAA